MTENTTSKFKGRSAYLTRLSLWAVALLLSYGSAAFGADLSLLSEATVQVPGDFVYALQDGRLDAPSVLMSAQKEGCKLRIESAGTIVPSEEFAALNPEVMLKNLYQDYRDFEPLNFSYPEFYQIGELKAVRTEGSILLSGRRYPLRVNTVNLPHVMLHVLELSAYNDRHYRDRCFEATEQVIRSLKPSEEKGV